MVGGTWWLRVVEAEAPGRVSHLRLVPRPLHHRHRPHLPHPPTTRVMMVVTVCQDIAKRSTETHMETVAVGHGRERDDELSPSLTCPQKKVLLVSSVPSWLPVGDDVEEEGAGAGRQAAAGSPMLMDRSRSLLTQLRQEGGPR